MHRSKFIQLKRALLFGFWGCAFSSAANAPFDIRVALVIGNSSYVHVSKLQNPANDAKEMSQSLRRLGFDVIELADGNAQDMREAVQALKQRGGGKQALAMLYYAGHGLQINLQNFLVPVDARLRSAGEVPLQTVALDSVVDVIKQMDTRMNILVLDACRDNPFAQQTVGSQQGLAPLDAPRGTIIAFATAPGNVADDGEGKNGLYTGYLLREMANPTARIEDVFKRTRLAVRQHSKGRQIPWEVTSLEEDFAFHQGVRGAGVLLAMAKSATPLPVPAQAVAVVPSPPPAPVAVASPAPAVAPQPAPVVVAAAPPVPAPPRPAAPIAVPPAISAATSPAISPAIPPVVTPAPPPAARPAPAIAPPPLVIVATPPVAAVQPIAVLPKPPSFEDEKQDWDRIRDSKSAQEVYAFLQKHPSGYVSEFAQARLEAIEPSGAQVQADATGVAQPSNAVRFRVGDTYVFNEKDSQYSREMPRVSYQVLSKRAGSTGDVFIFSNGYEATQQGAIVRTTGGAAVDPPQQWIPATEYTVGKKWKTRSIMTLSTGQKIWVEMTGQILGREKVTVPAGSFDTYKMEMTQTAEDKSILKVTYWGQPDWGVAVKQLREVTAPSGAKTSRVLELVERKRGG